MTGWTDGKRSALASGRVTMTVVPRVERQHRLLEELRVSGRRVGGEALAQALGVNVRTVERDVAELRAAGLKIEVQRGTGGGYRFVCPSRLPPITFTPSEAGGLVSALVSVGPFASAAAQSALLKLLDALDAP